MHNLIEGIMVSMLVSSIAEDGFEPRIGSSRKLIKLIFAPSLLTMQHYGVRGKTGGLGNQSRGHVYSQMVVSMS